MNDDGDYMFKRYAVSLAIGMYFCVNTLNVSYSQNLFYYSDGNSDPVPYKPFEHNQEISSGQNSFNETQIRRLLKENGFIRIDRLWLDERGIWRGIIQVNDKNRAVAIDYLGHIAIGDLGAFND